MTNQNHLGRFNEALLELVGGMAEDAVHVKASEAIKDEIKKVRLESMAEAAIERAGEGFDYETYFRESVDLDDLVESAVESALEQAIEDLDLEQKAAEEVDFTKLVVEKCDFSEVADRLLDEDAFAAMIRREIREGGERAEAGFLTLKSEVDRDREQTSAEVAYLRQEINSLRDQLAAACVDIEALLSRTRRRGILAWLGLA